MLSFFRFYTIAIATFFSLKNRGVMDPETSSNPSFENLLDPTLILYFSQNDSVSDPDSKHFHFHIIIGFYGKYKHSSHVLVFVFISQDPLCGRGLGRRYSRE